MKAKWIGFISDKRHEEIGQKDVFGCVAQYYRKTFVLKEKPVKATVKLAALGIFTVYINGKKASEEYFAPGWTNYNKTILTREYDVTELLETQNAISVCVGEGWYSGFLSIKGRNIYGKPPHELVAEITVIYADGTKESVSTDESWKAGTGAIRENDFLGGEIYDSRLPHEQISLYGFDDSSWENVYLTEDKSDRLKDLFYEPVVLQENFSVQTVSRKGNATIYDCGQNLAGVVSLRVKGEAGKTIQIRHGEMLALDGSLYVENLRLAKAIDTFICNGDEFVYTPTMTFHGFRYFEVIAEEGVEVLSISVRAMYNDLKWTGELSTSSELTNKLISNIRWGMKSNFVDLPMDCPQRNERLGWSGDTQVFSRTAMYFADCRRFYEKHILCINDDRKGGEIPDVIPYFGVSHGNATGWRDVAVVVPYNLWEMYGDVALAKAHVPLIRDFFTHQLTLREDGIWTESFYNDWLNVDEDTDPAVLATLSMANCLRLACKMFKAIGEDCSEYEAIFEDVKTRFIEKFIKNNKLISETQTAYAMAYTVGFISDEMTRKGLTDTFVRRKNHIHAGFIGLRFILPVLCEVGLVGLAYDLVTKSSYPSWGYSIVNGATTIWERWDSYTIENGFQDSGMNSFNHYSLGSCGEWFYEYGLGIKPLVAGFERVRIEPYVDGIGKITSMSGSFDSVHGKIEVRWQKTEDGFVCEIKKPKTVYAEFVFEDARTIEQDGVAVGEFSPYAEKTVVYFG